MILAADILATVERLPTLNINAIRLMELMNDENATFADIEAIVRTDPALTTNILKTAGSAHFGLRRSAETVREAIALLGLRRLIDVVTLAAIADIIPDRLPGYDISSKAFWRHCVAVAVLAERLARVLETGRAGLAFTAGLLHDLGKLVVGTFWARQCTASKATFRSRRLTTFESERLILGTDHAEVGMLVARSWRLPEVVALVNWEHHTPFATRNEADNDCTVAVVRLADSLAHAFGFGAGPGGPGPWLDPSVLESLNLSQSVATQVAWASLDEIEGLVGLLPEMQTARKVAIGAGA
jgi:putative nucleotidyltransferase with HDIG domain